MRVYLAATVLHVRRLVEEGSVTGPLEGFAATDALREEWGDEGEEELEFALSLAAAEASAAIAGPAPAGEGRRVVIVAELEARQVRSGAQAPGAIAVPGLLLLEDVDAVLADPADRALHGGVSDDLAWFAPQEIESLLA